MLLGAVVFTPNVPDSMALYAIFGFVLFVSALGIVVSLFGCDACVARVLGDAF